MRKLLVGLALLMTVMLVLSACGGAATEPAAPAEEEAAPAE
jgi:hypothetical protein